VFGLESEPSEIAETSKCGSGRLTNPEAIVAKMRGMEGLIVEAIELDESQARVTLHGVPNSPGLAADVFDEIAESGIIVDMIVQSYSGEGTADLSFTFPKEEFETAVETSQRVAKRFGCPPPTSCEQIAQLSVYGIGLRSHTEVADRMFESLNAASINVEMINTSEVCVSVVVDARQGGRGLAALNVAFQGVMV
jgi:aspartate kinase